ncbi:MAG: OsmC family protein [Longimicrobiales bacterium]
MTQREAEAVQTAVQPIRIVVEWEGGQRYRGGRPGGPSLLFDGSREAAPGPVDGVIIALASCSAFDVVEILAKRRTPARSLSMTADYTRAEGQIPRRLTGLHLTFHVATDSGIEHVRRAVALAVDKYCSVAASLAPDVRITSDVELVPS